MSNGPIMVLLVGEIPRGSLELLLWLYQQGCRCHFAMSYRDACSLISRTQFDLVLSRYQLPDQTAFSLLDWPIGSPATLFLSTVVESGCLWLPILERGKRCLGAPLVRSNDFNEALARVLGIERRFDEMETVSSGASLESLSTRTLGAMKPLNKRRYSQGLAQGSVREVR
jgi:hypothetical protein